MEILKESCIYKLYCDNIDKIYIGHHRNFNAEERLNGHKSGRNNTIKKCGSADLFKLVNNIEDVKIDIIHRYTDISLDQLRDYERQTILEYGFYDNKLFNKCLPYGLEKEERRKKTKRDYYERNTQLTKDRAKVYAQSEKGKETAKLRYENNKETISQKAKKRYQNNREEIIAKVLKNTNKEDKREYDRKRREENKEKLKEASKEMVLCVDCNEMIRKQTKARHERTKKHIQNKNKL